MKKVLIGIAGLLLLVVLLAIVNIYITDSLANIFAIWCIGLLVYIVRFLTNS